MTAEVTRANRNGSGSNDAELTARRREEIMLAACAVFDEQGYANTRIADISAHVGIGQGTIYRYFTGKGDLMGHLVAYGAHRVLIAMQEDSALTEAGGRNAEQFTEQITSVARRVLAMAAAEPRLVRVLLNQAPAVLPERVDELLDQLSGATAAYLEAGIEAGYLRAGLNAPVVATAMTGSVVPLMLKAARGHLAEQDRESAAVAVGAFVAQGVLSD